MAPTRSGDEPHRGLEEVDPEAQHLIDGVEGGGCLLALVALVTDETAGDHPVGFFDVVAVREIDAKKSTKLSLV